MGSINLMKTNGKVKDRAPLNLPSISLMYPHKKPELKTTSGEWENDLSLNEVVKALTPDKRYSAFIRQSLTAMNTDPDVIAWRQAVLADFLNNPDLDEKIS